ncbi:5-oxoprolinase subunit B family protein [Phaeovulum sp.]|uniref:5-oxoprolinase subunit B family protein n=1 Tax=Phaeovulum sp. TaxID=2934796 RepID=UPI0039E476A6
MADPRFIPVADHALLVEFATEISDAANAAVRALDRALAADPPKGLREVVPAFVNLLVDFDPDLTDHSTVEAAVRGRLSIPATKAPAATTRVVEVCYDPDLARDLAAVAAATGLEDEAVIKAHLAGDYRVFMYGFAPGYAYLAGVPPAIRVPRKPAPLRGITAGSVLIAGPQCLVTTLTMPTGWSIIGRSPTQILCDDPARPFLFDVGDRVSFKRIDRATFERAQKVGQP